MAAFSQNSTLSQDSERDWGGGVEVVAGRYFSSIGCAGNPRTSRCVLVMRHILLAKVLLQAHSVGYGKLSD